MKANFKFQIGTVGAQRYVAYIITVNDGWYTAAHLLTARQRQMLTRSSRLRRELKMQMKQKFWRFLGAA